MLSSFARSTEEGEETAFRVDKIGSESVCRIVAVNKSLAPVSVAVRIAGDARQYRVDRAGPLRDVIAPNSTHEIARIHMGGDLGPCQAEMTYTHSVGNMFAMPDRRYRYRLPFRRGAVALVIQEPTGVLTTHRDALNRYAIDFAVPLGTPVLAARAGTVIEIRDAFIEGRADRKLAEKTNLVSIMHADGTFAQYVHLAPHSIPVHPGERVEAGQLIGKSGNSGFAGGPHLHFDLRRARIGANDNVVQESLPFSFFRQKTGEKVVIKQRRRVRVD